MRKAFEATTLIARPADAVWAIITDFAGAPRWMPGIERVSAKDEAPIGAGKVFEVAMSTTGRGKLRDMTLADWDPEKRTFALASQEGSVRAVYRYALHPEGQQTRVRLDAACDGGGLMMTALWPLIRYLMKRHDSRQLPLLKALVEA